MARKDYSLLGIDLHEHEIRVVQITTRMNRPSIGKIGRTQMPPGALHRGKIMLPSSVGVALRLLLNSMDLPGGARAVVGVLGDTTALRTLPVPPVPDQDLPMIVAGEVDHYGLIRTEGGTHSFLKLYPPPRTADGEGEGGAAKGDADNLPVHVTIIALEEDVISSHRQAIEEADISIESIEPTQYAMYRAAVPGLGDATSAFNLMVNPSNTDIAITYKGKLVAYRRVDIGSRAILLNAPPPPAIDQVDPSKDVFVDDFSERESLENILNFSAIDGLSIEVQRTFDYYQREFPSVHIGDRIYLCIDDIRLSSLPEELRQRLGIAVQAVKPVVGPNDSPDAAQLDASKLGPVFSAAYGLALQGAVMNRVPRMDLYFKERTATKKAETNRNFLGSILTSALAIVLGVVGYIVYGNQISQAQTAAKDKQTRAAILKATSDAKVQVMQEQVAQYGALKHEGVPTAELMDYIATALQGGESMLTKVSIAPDLTVSLEGESVDDGTMIATSRRLQACPLFTDLQLVSFRHLDGKDGYGLGFVYSGKTITVDQVAQATAADTTKPTGGVTTK